MSEEARKREDDYYAGTMKDDYISRKAVLDMLDKECGSCADTGYIFSLPGIEVVRCKDCKCFDSDMERCVDGDEHPTRPDAFCSWAERRDG